LKFKQKSKVSFCPQCNFWKTLLYRYT